MRGFSLIIVVFILQAMALPIWCADGTQSAVVLVRLLPEVDVQPAKPVTLGDIADIRGPAAMVEKTRSIVVGLGPLPGKTACVYSDRIVARIQAELHAPIEVKGAEATTLLGKSVRIEGTRLAELAKSYLESQLPSDAYTYEVTVCRVPDDLVVASGSSYELRARLLNAMITPGPKAVAVDVVVDKKIVATTSVAFTVRAIAEVLTATRAIRQGEPIGPDNVRWESRDTTRIKTPITRDSGNVFGWIAKAPIAAGAVLTSTDIAPQFVVRKGETVSVTVTCGLVKLDTVGEVRQDGRIGDLIRVRPAISSQDVQARVIAPGTVLITR